MSAEGGVLFLLFGATGDLARHDLLPVLASLARRGELGQPFRLLGVSRDRDVDDEAFRKWVCKALAEAGAEGEGLAAWAAEHLFFQSAAEAGDYPALADRVAEIESAAGLGGNRIIYLALPPQAFAPVIESLGKAGLDEGPGWTRLVVEKPFGQDLASAHELNATLHGCFDEEQVFRIDHYIGKETVQNLLVFRFANPIFEALWNRDHIDHVQITVAESIGIGGRGDFYEGTGALKDMVQNHLTQLLTQIAMEVPVAYDAEAVHYEKTKVLRAIAPIRPADVVYGQYVGGSFDGEKVVGYLREEGVAEGSAVETFVALRLEIENWRWQGVPFYLRTGKRLPRRLTEVVVTFREPPVHLFASLDCRPRPNSLVITLQPDEGFALYFDVKRPGEDPVQLERLPLTFSYSERFGALPDAYETLLQEVVEGDRTLFVHADEAEAAWRLYQPLLGQSFEVHPYPAGSWGPEAADELLRRDGRSWGNV